jgi:hypothetical protein
MKQPDHGRAEDDDGAGKEHRTQSLPPGEQPERGAAEPNRHVKKDRVGAHREARLKATDEVAPRPVYNPGFPIIRFDG